MQFIRCSAACRCDEKAEQTNYSREDNVAQGTTPGEEARPSSADVKVPNQLRAQWFTPAGLSATLLFLAVVFYFTGLAYRETYFDAFGVDFTLLPLEKQDYIYLGGKVMALSIVQFITRALGSSLAMLGIITAGIVGALSLLFGEWAEEKRSRLRAKAPQWVRGSTFTNVLVVVTSGAGFPLITLLLPLFFVVALVSPDFIGEAFARQTAGDIRAAATVNCTQQVKKATCVEVFDDGDVIIRGILLGAGKDRIALLNAEGVQVISLGTKTVKPLF